MPDKDLRRAALGATKTTSRKARARSALITPGASQPGSARGSRAASRVASRNVSDDEDERSGNLSDDTNQSINSVDAFLESDEFAESNLDNLKSSLITTIDAIIERKGSSVQGREEALERYCRILTSHHFGDVLYGRVDEIIAALSRSVKAESSSKETVFALRAISLTTISFENDSLYESVSSLVRKTIADSQDFPSKAAAIHTLGMALTFGGAGNDEIRDQCVFLMAIVQSDGSFVGADDDAAVVCAAIQTYSFLITQLDDVEDDSEDSVEALLEQLDANNVNVQIAAGEAIGLLFEKSYTKRDPEADSDDDDEELSSDSDGAGQGNKNLVKRYNAYHNPSEVLDKVSALANLSSKGLHRDAKRKLHQAFASVAITVENPRMGLQTNNSSRMIVRIHKEGEIKLDEWSKFIRLQALKRLLAGGFINHYSEGNKQVVGMLPVLVGSSNGLASPTQGGKSRGMAKSGDRYRTSRRFVSGEA